MKNPPPIGSEIGDASAWYPLFDHMSQAHGLTLLDDELADIASKAEESRLKASSDGVGNLEPVPSWMLGDSVEARNALQNCGRVHPYTCGNDRTDEAHRKYQAEHGGDFGQLVAVEDGWLCPVCGYTQKLSYAMPSKASVQCSAWLAGQFLPWNHPLHLDAECMVRRYNDYAQVHLPSDSKRELAELFLAFLRTHWPP